MRFAQRYKFARNLTNMFLAFVLFLISQEGGRMIYFSENIIVRHRLLGLRVYCVCTRESLHYIFISVSRAFAGYLRQIVRLSGFAVPIFLKRGCSGEILLDSATRRKIVLYDIVYTECITACKINHIIDIAVILPT